MLKAGICNTDLEITRGYFGFQGVLKVILEAEERAINCQPSALES
jgi:hypothetical protein